MKPSIEQQWYSVSLVTAVNKDEIIITSLCIITLLLRAYEIFIFAQILFQTEARKFRDIAWFTVNAIFMTGFCIMRSKGLKMFT